MCVLHPSKYVGILMRMGEEQILYPASVGVTRFTGPFKEILYKYTRYPMVDEKEYGRNSTKEAHSLLCLLIVTAFQKRVQIKQVARRLSRHNFGRSSCDSPEN